MRMLNIIVKRPVFQFLGSWFLSPFGEWPNSNRGAYFFIRILLDFLQTVFQKIPLVAFQKHANAFQALHL